MGRGTGDPVWRSDLPAARIAIVAALEIEARIPRRIAGQSGSVYVSGPGARRAFATAERAVAGGAGALISFGLAGGLTGEAWTGRLFLPELLISEGGEWRADPAWRGRLMTALAPDFELLEGALFTADSVVDTPELKSALTSRSGAVAVDMESAAVARVAQEAGVPFVVLRAIADGHDDVLPANVIALVTDTGQTHYRQLVRFLGTPRRLRLLIRLGARSRSARRELRRALQVLVRSAGP